MKELLRNIGREGFPKPWQSKAMTAMLALVLFFFPFSILFVAGGLLPERFSWMASVIIFLNGAATFLSELRVRSVLTATVTLVVLAGGLFSIELLGVRTGFPFGHYEYSNVLGFVIVGVPVAISIAWYTAILNTWRIVGRLFQSGSLSTVVGISILAALLTTLLDVLLEPMATSVAGYWTWTGGVVPFQNYASWFILSALAVAVLATTSRAEAPPPAMSHLGLLLYGMQCILFALTNLVHGYALPVFIVLAILSAAFVLGLALHSRVQTQGVSNR